MGKTEMVTDIDRKRGAHLAELRGNRTQEEVARAIGTSRGNYAKMETGERDLKSEHCIALSKYYGVTCDELLTTVSKQKIDDSGEFILCSNKAFETLKNDNEIALIIDMLLRSDEGLALLKDIREYVSATASFEADYFTDDGITLNMRTSEIYALKLHESTTIMSIKELAREFIKKLLLDDLDKLTYYENLLYEVKKNGKA